MSDPCLSWASEEGHGRAAAPTLMAAWTAAGATMQIDDRARDARRARSRSARSPRRSRSAAAPSRTRRWTASTTPDGVIYDGDGVNLISPIDEFNAPVGAGAVPETAAAMFPAAADPRRRRPLAVRLVPAGSTSPAASSARSSRRRFRRRRDAPGLRGDAHDDLRAAHRRLRGRHDAGRAHRDARDLSAQQVAGRRRSHDPRRLLAGPHRLHAAPRGLDDRRLRAERHVLGPARAPSTSASSCSS